MYLDLYCIIIVVNNPDQSHVYQIRKTKKISITNITSMNKTNITILAYQVLLDIKSVTLDTMGVDFIQDILMLYYLQVWAVHILMLFQPFWYWF